MSGFRPSQIPKSPPRPAARTEPEIIVDVDLSEIDESFGDRETPLLPSKPKKKLALPTPLRLYALLEGVFDRRSK